MGLSPFGRSSSVLECTKPDPRNPDPKRYTILSHSTVNQYLILDLQYPNCTNYEGRKILLFDRGVTLKTLRRQGMIDPHFHPSEIVAHPIARFEPTPRGHAMAVRLCQTLDSEFGARHGA